MRKRLKFIIVLLATALLLSGCIKPVDQMYCIPRRSERFTQLQSAIDDAMTDLSYSAPVDGANLQAVQAADLNGDGLDEYLVFAKAEGDLPLRILIFGQTEDSFRFLQTIGCHGASFDTVAYTDMNGNGGAELIVGCRLSDRLLRNVSVYTFTDTLQSDLLLSTSYEKIVCADLDDRAGGELFLLKPGAVEESTGIAEVYTVIDGKVERSGEIHLSGAAANLKSILAGKIQGDIPAIYATTAVADSAVVTDVYIFANGELINLAASGDSDAEIKTLRSHYAYADDIDSDGVLELPYLMPMMPMENMVNGNRQELIRWYSLTDSGEEIVKFHTFHNFQDGWYLQLDSEWAAQLTVVDTGDAYEFYIWDPEYVTAEKVLTVFPQADINNEEAERFALHDGRDASYAAKLEDGAARYGLTPQSVIDHFHLITQMWKTEEK